MQSRIPAWLAVSAGVLLALVATDYSGWAMGAIVAGTLVLTVPLSVKRYRLERNLARSLWRALTMR